MNYSYSTIVWRGVIDAPGDYKPGETVSHSKWQFCIRENIDDGRKQLITPTGGMSSYWLVSDTNRRDLPRNWFIV